MPDEALTRMLTEAREHYLAHYRAVVRRAKAEHVQAVPELLIELNAVGPRGLFRRLTRVDIVWGGAANPGIIEANIDPLAPSDCLYSNPGPPPVRAFPLVWNACEVVCPKPIALDADFDVWFERWLDLSDARTADEDGLAGVIHSVTIPGPVGNGWGFSVDLGSAPVDAITELLQLAGFRSAGSVDIGSFSYGAPDSV